ncbi:50S ribosomal protein L23 [Candidatus Gracilibacteria bacterium]|nr:MAG: 50S ribosomal protein L23 [Candidatus Gracilibacteria bacterium]
MLSLYSVIKSIVVTSKSTDAELRGVYTCMVDSNATKIDIKNAFRKLYKVEVKKINILNTREKVRFTKIGVQKKRRVQKKAMITLQEGQTVANFEKVA